MPIAMVNSQQVGYIEGVVVTGCSRNPGECGAYDFGGRCEARAFAVTYDRGGLLPVEDIGELACGVVLRPNTLFGYALNLDIEEE